MPSFECMKSVALPFDKIQAIKQSWKVIDIIEKLEQNLNQEASINLEIQYIREDHKINTDFKNRCISFGANGKDFGIAFQNIVIVFLASFLIP